METMEAPSYTATDMEACLLVGGLVERIKLLSAILLDGSFDVEKWTVELAESKATHAELYQKLVNRDNPVTIDALWQVGQVETVVPEGWALVPVAAPPEMLLPLDRFMRPESAMELWAELLAAAPRYVEEDPLPVPDWTTSPEWAAFWAVDHDGIANWFSHKPEPWGGRWTYQRIATSRHERACSYNRQIPDWESTLVRIMRRQRYDKG